MLVSGFERTVPPQPARCATLQRVGDVTMSMTDDELRKALEDNDITAFEQWRVSGGDVNATLTVVGEAKPVLFIAARAGSLQVVRGLLAHGATYVPDENGRTPLYGAAAAGHLQMVRALRDHIVRHGQRKDELVAVNADSQRGHDAIHTPSNNGVTPLCAASRSGHVEVVRELLVHGATHAPDNDGTTPLRAASYNGHVEVVRELLVHGATHAPNNNGWTPLGAASQKGHVEVVRELLVHGATHAPKHHDGTTPLCAASYNGHVEVVRELLAHGATHAPDNNGWTPLCAGSQEGHVEVVRELLAHGATHAPNNNGTTPLRTASQKGHVEVVRELLVHGATHAPDNNGTTPLCAASRDGHVEVVRELLAHGATHAPDKNGTTPLWAASLKGHVEVVRELLVHGATHAPNNNGVTPLCPASQEGHVEVVRELLAHGATHAPDNNGTTPLWAASLKGHVEVVRELLVHGATHAPDNDGTTPLRTASQEGHVEVLRELLAHGATHAPDNNGWTPLCVGSQEGHVEVVRELLVHGATHAPNNNGTTPLRTASHKGHVEVVRELLVHGATHAPNNNGTTPLWAASRDGHVEVVRELLAHGATHAPNNNGVTPLCPASQRGHVEVVRELLAHGGTHAPDKNGTTPLWAASLKGHVEVVRELLVHGATHTPNNNGVTPLCIASYNGHVEVVRELVAHGATHAPDNNGWTPLGAATQEGHVEVVRELLVHGATYCPNNRLMTPIHIAALNGHLNLVRMLLSRLVLKLKTIERMHPLLCAAARGTDNAEMIRMLVKDFHFNLESSDEGIYAIHFALHFGHKESVHALLDLGASVQPLLDHPLREDAQLNPPIAFIREGPDRVRAFVEGSTHEARKVLKVIVIGHGRAGKTTLLRAVEGAATHEPSVSTIGVEVRDMALPGMERLRMRYVAYDFAGQLQYLKTHHNYMSTRNALYLLVVDASLRAELRESHVKHWGEYFKAYLESGNMMASMEFSRSSCGGVEGRGKKLEKTLRVQLVATQADRLLREQDRTSCKQQLQRIQEQLFPELVAGPPVLVSGKRARDYDGIESVRDCVRAVAHDFAKSWMVRFVPESYVLVDAGLELALDARRRGVILHADEAETTEAVPWTFPVEELSRWSGVEGVGEAEADYLKQVGSAVLSPSKRFVCTNTELLSRCMALFVSPHEHMVAMNVTRSGSRHNREHRWSGRNDEFVLTWEAASERVSELIAQIQREQRASQCDVSRVSVDSVMTALQEWDLWSRVEVRNEDVAQYWTGHPCPTATCDGAVHVLLVLLSSRKTSKLFGMPPQSGVGRRVMKGVVARKVPQSAFDNAQLALIERWHRGCDVYVNGFIISSDGSSAAEAIAMVTRYDEGIVRVVACGRTNASLDHLMDMVKEAFAPKDVSDSSDKNERWEMISMEEARAAICGYETLQRVPWSWAEDKEFELAERHCWKRMDEEAATKLGLDPAQLAKHVHWSYLNDDQLLVLDESLDRVQVRRMCAPQRCRQLTPDERKTLREAGLDDGMGRSALSDLEYTELVPNKEVHPARVAEVERVCKWLERFVGEDGMEELEVVRVVALHNTSLERTFTLCYEEMNQRLKDRSVLQLERTTENDVKSLLQQHTLDVFSRYFMRDMGCDHVNLVMAWQGSQEKWLFSNACNGVRRMPPLTASEEHQLRDGNRSRLDFGFFGRGVYFTQRPSYGRAYSRVVQEKAAAGGDSGQSTAAASAVPCTSADASMATLATATAPSPEQSAAVDWEANMSFPLMLSFLLLGRPYAVTERSTLPFDQTLHGKPCVDGYDSHYALVGGTSSEMEPIGMNEDGEIEAEKADEIVVFGPPQVLPRYILYCAPRSSLPDPSCQRQLTLWVMSKGQRASLSSAEAALERDANVEHIHARNTTSVISWLNNHRYNLRVLMERAELRVVTSKSRPDDGGEQAAQNFIRQLRLVKWSNNVKVVVYDPEAQPLSLWNPPDGIYVTKSAEVVQEFSLFNDVTERRFLLETLQEMECAETSTDGGVRFVPFDPTRHASRHVTLWVEPNYRSSVEVFDCANALLPDHMLIMASLSMHVVAWLKLCAPDDVSSVRIITNRFRHCDGGEEAAAEMINYIHGNDVWRNICILVYCGRLGPAAHLWNPAKSGRVLVTTNSSLAIRFGAGDRMLTVQEFLDVVAHDLQVSGRMQRLKEKAHWHANDSTNTCEMVGCNMIVSGRARTLVTANNMESRRHHCRYCGLVLCDTHAPVVELIGNMRLCSGTSLMHDLRVGGTEDERQGSYIKLLTRTFNRLPP